MVQSVCGKCGGFIPAREVDYHPLLGCECPLPRADESDLLQDQEDSDEEAEECIY